MESPRLPRFKRASTVTPFQLTARDHEIIRLIHRHRFLRSSQIVQLISGSQQQILRRLKLLYHHAYLERPRCQLDYYHQGGSHPIVYGLGGKATSLLKPEGLKFREETNRPARRLFLDHALLVSDVMVSIELGCRQRGIRLLTPTELPENTKGDSRRFRWKVKVHGGSRLSVVPDRIFALEFQDGNRTLFFLEADRGTMPVVRSDFSQTSFYRKLLAYEASWSQAIHRTRFGFSRFRVLTVTTSAARVKSLVDACSKLKRGRGLFLFADRTVLSGDMFSPVWQTGKPGETGSLLD